MKEKKEALAASKYENLLPNLADYIRHYSKKRKNFTALAEFDTGENISWKKFNQSVDAFAAKLLSLGFKKGDIVATSLPLLKEHVYLIYACYRTGIILAPLDLRLKGEEIIYCFKKIQPKAYFFLGKTPLADFRPMITEVMNNVSGVNLWVQFQKEPEFIIKGAVGITDFAKDIKKVYIKSLFSGTVRKARSLVEKRDPCLIIFTTGSTGSPKPALLCHENILIQNIGLSVAFEMTENDTMLVNLPPSHVGCVTEQLATSIFGGCKSVILHIFNAEKSLKAIEQEKVTVIGQIPALFNLEWQLPDYAKYDLSSLRFILYGGQEVPVEFLRKMQAMAPKIGTGLGLTETAGFCTYTDTDAMITEIARSIGFEMKLTPISIREPMTREGFAGKELARGEIGEICFSGPQIFPGYYKDEESTAKSVSKDRVCYTGDLGYYDNEGLHFVGRAKFVIKPKGYQVYPQDVVNHISQKLGARASAIACVGVPHDIYMEAIMAFVEPAPGANITPEEVIETCSDISSYSRPSHAVILEPGNMPLNRVAKVDYMSLKTQAIKIIDELREKGDWDRGVDSSE
ncbi:MAG TPA: class I adenylate-forming enzyme family protein [Spirochaetota bacterium]|nr:class I adenylate-forming enzyme family protein [Spirochaetota bacterium]HPS85141.1 class I adenylate-forming enzyme family protein [Spirochaetota bacterium]